MSRFPEIDFALLGTMTRQTAHGVVSEDEWGQYALLKGVLPANTADSPYRQTLSAFENLEHELVSIGMTFSHVVRTWLYADRILDWMQDNIFLDLAGIDPGKQSLHIFVHIRESIGFCVLIQVDRAKQDVYTCINRHRRSINRVKMCCNGIHYHGVCNHDAVISHLFTQDSGDDLVRQGSRKINFFTILYRNISVCLDIRILDMHCHDHIRTFFSKFTSCTIKLLLFSELVRKRCFHLRLRTGCYILKKSV